MSLHRLGQAGASSALPSAAERPPGPGNPSERPDEESPTGAGFLRVTEIFRSVQGESTWAGLPCTFVRLTGCPLRCVWCDTEYSFHGGSASVFRRSSTR